MCQKFLLFLYFSSEIFFLCEAAALDIFKNDLSQVGSAVENFTFDILKQIIVEDEGIITTTENNVEEIKERKIRSVDANLDLCLKECRDKHAEEDEVEAQRIQELRKEVEKLQELVNLLKNQQKIIDVLDDNNINNQGPASKNQRAGEVPDSTKPTIDQLAAIKADLRDAIVTLNHTQKFIALQREKDIILEEELSKQQEEIVKLRTLVDSILDGKNISNSDSIISARASDLSELTKMLKNDDDEEDVDAKVLDLVKELRKKKRKQQNSGALLKQLVKALKTEPESKSFDDGDVAPNLDDLEEAINNLRPKEDNSGAQFQAVLTKLLNRNQRLPVNSPVNSPVKLPTSGSTICFVDRGPSSRFSAPQFFPAPNYYAPPIAAQENSGKFSNYQGQAGEDGSKYQEDLKQQIEGLQVAIDNLNRPENTQRLEDKAVIDDLERQIGDLRNLVNGLNYDANYRAKRSTDNNQIDDKIVDKMADLVGKMLVGGNDTQKEAVHQIQDQINTIRKQLGSGRERAAAPPQDPIYPEKTDMTYSTTQQIKSSNFQDDFFAQLISKVLDKLISAIPIVVRKLFNFSLDELGKNDYKDYDVQMLFKNLGIFAYLPVIFLRLINGISYLMKLLKKNTFFRTFLVPLTVLGIVAGSVLFLIWWLQPDENAMVPYTPDTSNYVTDDPNKYPANPNIYSYPTYSRGYTNQ